MSIISEYLYHHTKYSDKYGVKTIVLMQIGSFHEAYSTLSNGPNLKEISNLLNICLTRKDKSNDTINESNPYMLGFPSYIISKYLNCLIENDYNVVVIDQITPPPQPKRAVTGIYTRGTYIDNVQNSDSNNIVSLYIENILINGSNILCIGMSSIDLSIGKPIVHESIGLQVDKRYSLDEAMRFIIENRPTEIIINFDANAIGEKDKIILYLELENTKYYANR